MRMEKDEIAQLARQTMGLGERCYEAIERNIAEAHAAHHWDEMNKWCRVRLRVQRFRQEQRIGNALARSNARREPKGSFSGVTQRATIPASPRLR